MLVQDTFFHVFVAFVCLVFVLFCIDHYAKMEINLIQTTIEASV